MKQTETGMTLAQKARLGLGFVMVSALVIGTTVTPFARADTYGDQINQLLAENATNNQAVTDLAMQATSYQDAISRLQSSIALLQAQINDSNAKLAALRQQIADGQAKLDQQKAELGDNLKTMYVNGQMSTIEMLASTNDLSSFVDAETYRGAVQAKIQQSLKDIAALQNKLNEQQRQTELLLKQQQTQQSQLAANQAQQSQLLALNQGQQAAYNQKTKDNQAKIDDLIAAQRRANLGSGNGALYAGSTSYPFANAGFSMSTAPGCNDNDGPDPWGYCTRQCVSYTAWAVLHSGRKAPMYYGNARDWVGHAQADGVPVVGIGQARPGDVAISTAGTWGHAMYVEKVSGNQVYVSQYNANLDGQFSYQWRDGSSYFFLRFP